MKGEHVRPLLGLSVVCGAAIAILGAQLTPATVFVSPLTTSPAVPAQHEFLLGHDLDRIVPSASTRSTPGGAAAGAEARASLVLGSFVGAPAPTSATQVANRPATRPAASAQTAVFHLPKSTVRDRHAATHGTPTHGATHAATHGAGSTSTRPPLHVTTPAEAPVRPPVVPAEPSPPAIGAGVLDPGSPEDQPVVGHGHGTGPGNGHGVGSGHTGTEHGDPTPPRPHHNPSTLGHGGAGHHHGEVVHARPEAEARHARKQEHQRTQRQEHGERRRAARAEQHRQAQERKQDRKDQQHGQDQQGHGGHQDQQQDQHHGHGGHSHGTGR